MSEHDETRELKNVADNDSTERRQADGSSEDLDSRREFISRLARTAAAPAVVPLMLSMPTAALA